MNRAWGLLVLGSIVEIFWVMGLKHADTTLAWVGTILAILLSFGLLIKATSQLPVGTAYAVFTGLGTTGTVLAEILVFGEPFQLAKILLILILLIGVIGLKVVTTDSVQERSAS